MKEKIRDELNQIFKVLFKDNQINITEDTSADSVDGWDSITHLSLIVEVEKKFNIEITGFDVMNLKNVGDLINLIIKKQSN